MRCHKQKRGFTLVEMLVVIAILAVLATVSVVGYTSFIERANLSKDTLLLSQCNTVLDICAVYEGRNLTMAQALSDLSDNGVEVTELKASAKHCDIVWDSSADRFLLVKEGTVVYPDLEEDVSLSGCFIAVYDGEGIDGTYSVYLAGAPLQTELSLNNVGFDDGGNAVSFTLSGDTAEAVVVNTVGGNATVNLPQGTVHHYGSAEQVTVEAIGDASYHVYGQIELFTLYSGHLVLESGAVVNQLLIHGGTVLCRKGATVGTTEEDAEHIENQGGSVTILPTVEPSFFAGGDGSRENPYLLSTPQQFSNIATLMDDNYYEQEETILLPYLEEVRAYASELGLDEDCFYQNKGLKFEDCMEVEIEHDIGELPEEEIPILLQACADAGLSLETVDTLGLKYTTVSGGKIDCIIYYEVKKAEALERMTYGNQYYYFRLTADISLPNDYTPIPVFFGELDGAGYSLSAPAENSNGEQVCVIFEEALAGSVFKNFEFCLSQAPYSLVGGEGRRTNGELRFEEITIDNQEEGSCVQVSRDGFGALTRYALHSWNAHVIVKNCVNRANFHFNDSASAVFVGERYLEPYSGDRTTCDNSRASFIDCTNFGTLSGTACAFWYIGVPLEDAELADDSWLTVENCSE